MRLDLFNGTQRGKNTIPKKKTSRRFERVMRCFDRDYSRKIEGAGSQGLFKHLKTVPRMRTKRRKSRQKMDQRGGLQVELWTDAV